MSAIRRFFDGINEIATRAFNNLYNLKKLIIPSCITKLNESFINNCQNLERIEINAKISESLKGKKRNYTYIWVHNEKQGEKISPELLDIYLKKGYKKGRFPLSAEKLNMIRDKRRNNANKKSEEEVRLFKENCSKIMKAYWESLSEERRIEIGLHISESRKNNPNCCSPRKGVPAIQ